MDLTLIAAISENGVIGNNEILEDGTEKYSMPWPWIKEDMLHFERLTKESGTVIMGRKTYISLPDRAKPLKERQNIILTRDRNFSKEGIYIAHSLEEAIEMSESNSPYLMGGGEIYGEAFDKGLVNKMEITNIHGKFEGNVYFPNIDWNRWNEISREKNKDENSGVEYSFVTYTPKNTSDVIEITF